MTVRPPLSPHPWTPFLRAARAARASGDARATRHFLRTARTLALAAAPERAHAATAVLADLDHLAWMWGLPPLDGGEG